MHAVYTDRYFKPFLTFNKSLASRTNRKLSEPKITIQNVNEIMVDPYCYGSQGGIACKAPTTRVQWSWKALRLSFNLLALSSSEMWWKFYQF